MLKIKMKTLGANQRSIDKTMDVTEQIISIQHQCNVRHTSNDSKRKYKQGDYHSINTKF